MKGQTWIPILSKAGTRTYLERVPQTPWRGEYDLLPEIYKVCVGKDNTNVPEKYQLGGISEISRVYLEGKEAIKYWWRTE